MRQIIACFTATALFVSGAELPIREVVLYKHGIGYFERSGDIPAGETARLSFKAAEMNDVLKSLTVQGGKVNSLRYDASDPLAHRLAEFPFKFDAENPTLAGFLAQLRGARAVLQFGSETVTGTIVNARVAAGDEKRREREEIVLLTDSGDLRTLDLGAAQNVRLEDATLQAKLREYLRITAAGRMQDRRNVYIDSVDSGARKVTASYVAPAPIWKSSYRLLLGETPEPMLEGWAIVDNTSGEDWTKVRLALVSGRPVSFISLLYEPRYLTRQIAHIGEEGAAAPRRFEASQQLVMQQGPQRGQFGAARGAPAAPATANEALADRALQESVLVTDVAATAEGREIGDLFEYGFAAPVTVKAGESAMLPFLQQKVSARKLLIYSGSGVNPMNAAEIVNATGKTLDGGPITVFDAGSYAGEALISTTKTGDKRLISYGMDLGTRISTKADSESKDVRQLRAQRGILITRHAQVDTRVYSIRNVDPKAKTLVIEQPIRPGYKLIGVKPYETTQNYHRFEVKLAPSVQEKFTIVEEREYEQSHAISNMNAPVLVSFAQNKALSDAGRKQLESILEKKRLIAEADADNRRVEAEIQSLFQDQNRLRENIRSLNQVGGQQAQVQKYAAALATQEAHLTSLRDAQAGYAKRKRALEIEVNAEIEALTF